MNKTIFITSLFVTNFVFSAEEVDYFSMSDSFAECSALQNTLARMVTNSEEEYINHYLHQVANGAIMVAADFAVSGGYEKELANTQYQSHFSKFQSMLSATIDSGNTDSFVSSVKPIMDKCAALNQLQAKIIEEKRKEAYKSK